MDEQNTYDLDQKQDQQYGSIFTIDILLKDHQEFHSNLQIDSFIIIKNGLTPYGMYKQALRELKTRWEALKADEARFSEIYSSNMMGLHSEEVTFELDTLRRANKDRKREFCRFFAIAQALKNELGEITEEKREGLEIDYWVHKIKAMMAKDVLSEGRINPERIDLVKCLPVGPRSEISTCFQNRESLDQLVQWFWDFTPELPEFEKYLLPFEKIEKICLLT